ncbi:hypothetical protein NIES4071_64900 [Calothrix sp. NIES-4071]|nr:hypothetical protein NIES4071_64900 [Calothrix sp. NIES-4071]BAZ60794.1 hypothetical protein NIES4105_64860 [Calothrix sp. NIES-4105]
MTIGEEAFALFKRAVETGEYQPMLDAMVEDYKFVYPVPGSFHGENRGRDVFANYLQTTAANLRPTLELYRTTHLGNITIFEFNVSGTLNEQSFQTSVAQVYEEKDGFLIGHQEYIGDLAPFMAMADKSKS